MKRIVFTIAFSLFAIALMAQVPAGFNYQAVVRNSSGEIVANKTVKFRISILQNSGIGTAVYVETHSVPTGNFGLANFVVGLGNRVSGDLDHAVWGNNPHFLKIELDPDNGNSFAHLGTMQLLAVPYAFHAKTVEIDKVDDADHDPTNEIQMLSLSGMALSLSRGGGTVTLPAVEGDNWGNEYVRTDASLSGQGTSASPLKLSQQSASTGQVLKWNGTSWVPADDIEGSGETAWQTAGDNVYRTTGKVGIGTSTPSAQLHVQETAAGQGNVVFAGEVKTASNQGNPPVTGAGTRLMWYPDKAALRAGYVGGTRWDKANIGNYSVAFGYSPLASGANSVAMGVSPTASGGYSTAFGYMPIASGENSIAMGNYAEASGQWSVAMGNHTNASGVNSTAMGKETSASGDNSATLGQLVRAYSFCETVIGYRNTPYTPQSTTGWNENDRLFVIGNGGTTNSNAITVLKSGKIGIGSDTPEAEAGLHLRGNGFPDSFIYIESDVGQDAGIRLYEGKTVKWHIFNEPRADGLRIYNTGGNVAIFAKQSNAFVGLGTINPSYKLHVVGNAYKTEGGNTWASSSDLRLKTVLGDYEKGLNEITALQPVRFRYLENNPQGLSSDSEQVGFVAQEVQEIFPEAVSEAEDGYLDFNIHAVNVALVNAVKQLKAENDRLKAEMVLLRTEYETRLSRVETLISDYSEK